MNTKDKIEKCWKCGDTGKVKFDHNGFEDWETCDECKAGERVRKKNEAQIAKRKIEEWLDTRPAYQLSNTTQIHNLLDWLDKEDK